MSTKSKAFHQLLLEHATNPKKVKRLLGLDRRLTQDEKQILNCFMAMRANQNAQALATAKKIKPQQEPFIESMRFFLIGSLQNNLGHQTEALQNFQHSLKLLPPGFDNHLHVILLVNLYHIQVNRKDLSGADVYLKEMVKISASNEDDLFLIKKCQFNFATLTGDDKSADKLRKELEKYPEDISSHLKLSSLLDLWDFGIVFGQFEYCFDVLEKLKEHKVYALTQNYNYMKILLEHFKNNAPIYLFEKDFEHHRKLLTELRVIRALSNNRIHEAQIHWKALMEINPLAFKDGFSYVGFKTIFSLCLDLHKDKLKVVKAKYQKDPAKSISENILSLILKEKTISKEELFEFLFDRMPESKDDMNRLAREIYRVKTLYGLGISSKKGQYTLIQKSA